MLVIVRNLKDLRANASAIRDLVTRLEDEAGPLLGVWCDPDGLVHPPDSVTVRCAEGVFRNLPFRYSFELAGIWAVWCFERPEGFLREPARTSHEVIAAALLGQGRPPGRDLYVPVFDAARAPADIAAEMGRLVSAHPLRIGPALYHDRARNVLSWTQRQARGAA